MNKAIHEEFDVIKTSVDTKVVKLRSEFDINLLNRNIDRKIGLKEYNDKMDELDMKINFLDNNTMRIANDFEGFQKAMIKQNQSITELQEANRDVLLGGKPVGCLSCAKGTDGYEPKVHVVGKDG